MCRLGLGRPPRGSSSPGFGGFGILGAWVLESKVQGVLRALGLRVEVQGFLGLRCLRVQGFLRFWDLEFKGSEGF